MVDNWSLIERFLQEEGLVRQHIDSYNDFIDYDIQAIIDETKEIPIEAEKYSLKIRFGKITVGTPRVIEVDGAERQIYPMEARIRNLTYSAPIHLEMTTIIDGREARTELVYVGDMPVMLKSKICPLSKLTSEELRRIGEDPLDPGGYFIVNGSERVIVGLEDLAPNRILVEIEQTGVTPTYKAKMFSTTVGFRARIEAKMKNDGAIYLSTPGIPVEVPIMIMIKALGVEEDVKIAEMVSPRDEIQAELAPSFEKASGIISQRDALQYLGNRLAPGQVEEYRMRKAENLIDRNLLPHVGASPEKRIEKAYLLAEIARRIIELKLGIRDEDDKDHYANKRLKLAGPLLSDLFRIAFRTLTRDMKYQLEKVIIRRHGEILVSNAVRPGIITERLQHAIATGNWVRGRVGVTQLLDRTSYYSTLSHLRRLQSPLSRSQPNLEARDLHSTHWGRLCPNETPEGSNCGLVKNLALSSEISVGCPAGPVIECLKELGVTPMGEASKDLRLKGSKVFVDGLLLGYTADPETLAAAIRRKRREGKLSHQINVAYHKAKSPEGEDEILVNCDEGRVRRPLIVVEDGTPLLSGEDIAKVEKGEVSWLSLIERGVIEYLDSDEEENALVALDIRQITPETTHLEISPYA
ncbi:MAG: DNA-directed RNA polymerase subunit B'', partial [Candidatus Bathyarchaeia archaeon]